MPVIAQLPDALLRRDGHVVGAIGFSSVSDGVLLPDDALTRLAAFGLMLKNLKFRAQLLISTRPQNIQTYRLKMRAREIELDASAACVRRLLALLPAFAGQARVTPESARGFESHFGFPIIRLAGLPGRVSHVATGLGNPAWWSSQIQSGKLDESLERAVTLCRESLDVVAHWLDTVRMRADFVDATVRRLKRPVRVLLMVTSVPSRVTSFTSDVSAERFAAPLRSLDQRLVHFEQTIAEMGLPSWRLNEAELLDELLRVYRPAYAEDRSRHAVPDVNRFATAALLGMDRSQVPRMQESPLHRL
jgi:hypothetical protein